MSGPREEAPDALAVMCCARRSLQIPVWGTVLSGRAVMCCARDTLAVMCCAKKLAGISIPTWGTVLGISIPGWEAVLG